MIALLGATGFIGTAFLEQALAAGESVRALVRDPGKLAPNPSLEVVAGDSGDVAAIDRLLPGAGAVVSLLGPRRGEHAPGDFLAASMTTLLAGMRRHHLTRLVAISGAAITLPGERKGFPHNLAARVVPILARSAFTSKKAELEVLLASSVDWTAVRPTRVIEGPVSGHLRASLSPNGLGFTVTRGDIASFLLAQVHDLNFIRQAPYVSS